MPRTSGIILRIVRLKGIECVLVTDMGKYAIKFVAAQSVTANQLVVWLDRINRTLVHAGDNIRTQISFAKQDLALQRKGY